MPALQALTADNVVVLSKGRRRAHWDAVIGAPVTAGVRYSTWTSRKLTRNETPPGRPACNVNPRSRWSRGTAHASAVMGRDEGST
jgi:hypothetical protein